MSQTAPTNGASPVTEDIEVRDADEDSAALVRGATRPPASRRSSQALDYRFGSLRTGAESGAPVAAPRIDHRQSHHRPLLATAVAFVAIAAIAVFLVQAFVVTPYAVHGDAMTPTLRSGDRMLVVKPDILRGSLHAGEIVVVQPTRTLPCGVAGSRGGSLVLRVAAGPGDVISSTGDTVLVNGRPLQERGWYDPRFGQVGSTPIRTTTLAADSYFMLADNRSNGCDSRSFGPVPGSSIVGEGVAVVGRGGHVSLGTL